MLQDETQVEKEQRLHAYRLGLFARRAGLPATDNPYPPSGHGKIETATWGYGLGLHWWNGYQAGAIAQGGNLA